MYGHPKAQDVVDKMLETLEELAVPIRYMPVMRIDGQMYKH